MIASLIDSRVYRDAYGTEEMREIWSDVANIQAWLDVEKALARSQARLGLIPKTAEKEINAKANVKNLSLDQIRENYAKTGHPLVAMINVLKGLCENGAEEFIHFGATTQDILDTGSVLQTRSAIEVIERNLQTLEQICVGIAKEHKMTVMAGRTHGQHAVPITFGYKVAVWVEEIRRHLERLAQLKPRVLVIEFSGAAGTLATIPPEVGFNLQKELASELNLGIPTITWHSARDGFAELLSTLGIIMGTLSKIANEVVQLQRTEIAELEIDATGRIGSSTMPHKRNPVLMEHTIVLARFVQANANIMLESMSGAHERDGSTWGAEMKVISESFILSSAALAILNTELPRMKVRVDNMERNINLLGGLIMSERTMMKLASVVGRLTAHEIVYEDSMKAFESGQSLKKVLEADLRVTKVLSNNAIDELMNPATYLGLAPMYVDRVTGRAGK